MAKKSKKGLVPRLRFPEFRDAGEWERKRLSDIAEFYKGKGISKSDIDFQGVVPCIRYGELYTIYGEFIGEVYSKTNLSLDELFVSHHNDVLIPSSGETKIDIAKASCVLLDGIALGGDLNVLRPTVNGIFLSYLLNGSAKTEISKKAQGDTVVHLYASQLKLLEVLIPIQQEQARIAACLSSLDDLITAEAKKLDALKAHKKGLMQELFPREGETVPRLRFPEFRDAGEWEEKKIEDICEVIRGYGFPDAMQGKVSGEYPFCKVSDISRAVAEQGGRLACASNYIDNEELSQLKARPVPIGSTVFAKIGEALRLNRRAITVSMCLIDNNVTGLSPKNTQVNNYFIYSLSELIDLNAYCGGAIPSVNKSTLEGIVVFVPSVNEQQKIADCLSSLDDLIAAQARKVEALKTHKKGLMQQLFPMADTMAG